MFSLAGIAKSKVSAIIVFAIKHKPIYELGVGPTYRCSDGIVVEKTFVSDVMELVSSKVADTLIERVVTEADYSFQVGHLVNLRAKPVHGPVIFLAPVRVWWTEHPAIQ